MPFLSEVPPSFLLTGEGELSIIISIVNAPPMGRAVRRERIILAQEILMTADGFAAMKQELEELKTTKRKEISEKIRVARGFGDLSENSEYDEAKNEQAVVEARILLLEEQLKHVKIVEADDISSDVVSIGCTVKILDMEFNEETEYIIVRSVETSGMNTITDESPVGKALLGHKVGDVVEVVAPGGNFQFQVLAIGK